jgi:hypothetical protein
VGAQSFQHVLPEGVINVPGGKLGVNYASSALVAAVELAKRLVASERRAVEEKVRADLLEGRMEALEKRLDHLLGGSV